MNLQLKIESPAIFRIYPEARRGDSIEGAAKETAEQLDAGLVWWGCSFCHRSVLVSANIKGRERCECGAVRCHHRGQEGWRKHNEEWWAI